MPAVKNEKAMLSVLAALAFANAEFATVTTLTPLSKTVLADNWFTE